MIWCMDEWMCWGLAPGTFWSHLPPYGSNCSRMFEIPVSGLRSQTRVEKPFYSILWSIYAISLQNNSIWSSFVHRTKVEQKLQHKCLKCSLNTRVHVNHSPALRSESNSLKHDQTLSSLETFWLQKTEARPTNIHQITSGDLHEEQRVWGENHSESSLSGFFFNFYGPSVRMNAWSFHHLSARRQQQQQRRARARGIRLAEVWEIKTTVCEANETVNMQSNVLAKYAKCSYIFGVSKKQQY